MRVSTVDPLLTGLVNALIPDACPKTTWKAIGCGLVLITCLCGKALAQEQAGAAAMLPISITILYFDQSSHQLRPGVKVALDSIAGLLVGQPTLIATVTGYTDNVGKRELNLVLAKYRTKAVEAYLRQRGVLADQIIAQWEGPDKNALATDSKAVKTIRRRVIIQLSPRE